jgi:hypothetical protein
MMGAASHPLPIATRAQGVTAAERYLQRLCDRSFLSLWSYPSPYRDQKADGGGDGKEICDLLVVFGEDILIFSDKNCAFPTSSDIRVNWSRWYRKAILKAAEQSWGAERWIRAHPDRIFLDRACTERFPLDLPAADRMRVHHLVVVHDVAEACRRHHNGGSGSLIFNSDIEGRDHYDPGSCEPFHVGWLDGDRKFVHVLDDTSLDIVLNSRDTITDFVDYLRAKEGLLCRCRERGIRFFAAGEEELLANYLLTDDGTRHVFKFPEDINAIGLLEGDWIDFQKSPQHHAQIAADRVSYLWDALIEKFSGHILGGTSYYTTTPRIADRERIMRFFARERRVRRRLLADALLGLIQTDKAGQRVVRVVHPSTPGDPYYCFMVLPNLFGRPREEYRTVRGHLLEALCLVTKVVFPDALDIVGFATEPGIDTPERSEDSLYLDARVWNDEMEAHARQLQADHRLLTNYTKFKDKVAEFPIAQNQRPAAPGPNPRNKACPCGSGKKYKKCCGN